ncbi:cell division ATP-binding protein FtsE [Microbacterium gorillae]|uniref:cell division ATP-binding protein FtsE n=1 Tax=Microbacterium gorillae TaxID=1231063 RepID=UPI000591040D|nr:cell division ATP-binding protein FtsE [Microbacterium gorillae]
MIRFENVTKRYRGTAKPALADVDFEVASGEFVFLVGASGSGKSTCLQLILREQVPTSGRMLVLGSDLRKLSNRRVPYFRRHIGSVFQDFRLLSTKTVAQNVAFALQVTGASRGFVQQAVPEALELVGLAGKQKRMPHELSGGEQQRVAIARAIVNRPQILLADEPTGNLDPGTSTEIMRLLARINANGTTVVMATHEAGFVDQMRRRVIELDSGVITRDESHGGYGDTSAIPRLEMATERGAAATAALSAVLEVQREAARAVDEHDPAAAVTVSGSSRPAARPVTPASAAPEKTIAAAPTSTPMAEDTPTVQPAATPAAGPQPAAAPADRPGPTEASETTATAEVAAAEEDEAPELTRPGVEPETAGEQRPMTRPIALPDVQVDELGVADRLGLGAFDDDDEVGPTS